MFGQDTDLIKKFDKLESSVNKQTSSIEGLRQEDKKLVDRIDKHIEVYDSVSSQNMVKNEELENQISSNAESIDLIKTKKPVWTDKMKAYSALIATLIALYVALINTYNSQIKRLNEKEEYIEFAMNGLCQPIKSQASSLLALSENLGNMKFENANLKTESSLNFLNIDNIDHTDLYKIFVSNRKGKRKDKLEIFTKLEAALNRIRHIKNSIKTNHQNCAERLNSNLSLWNQSIRKISNYFDKEFCNTGKTFFKKNAFLSGYDQLFEEFKKKYQDASFHPRIAKPKLIDPLKEHCKKYKENNPKACDILVIIKECNFAYRSLENVGKDYKSVFKTYNDELLEDMNTIKDSLDKLLEIKRICWLFRLFS